MTIQYIVQYTFVKGIEVCGECITQIEYFSVFFLFFLHFLFHLILTVIQFKVGIDSGTSLC